MTQHDLDKRLQELRGLVENRDQLLSRRARLLDRIRVLEDRCARLQKEAAAEQADVDKLEGFSFAGLVQSLMGTKDENLKRERQEAEEAALLLESNTQALQDARRDLARIQRELADMGTYETQYNALLMEKAELLKEFRTPLAERLEELERRQTDLARQEKELREALQAAESAIGCAREVRDALNSAADWGTWDILGGGLMADAFKHSALDEAQQKLNHLNARLACLRDELDDVDIRSDLQVGVDGFLHFADFFFDGLFADLAVQDHIDRSRAQVEELIQQIIALRNRLSNLADAAALEQGTARHQWTQLVLESPYPEPAPPPIWDGGKLY